MSLQFRLGFNDQKVVEDFLCREPVATSAIVLDPKAGTRQRHAAEAAAAAGVDVLWDPGTELLSYEGYELEFVKELFRPPSSSFLGLGPVP